MAGRAPRRPVRRPVHAGARLRRHDVPQRRHERGLPLPQRVDARRAPRRTRSCRCWSTSTAAASWPATARSRATTARAWRRRGIVVVTLSYRLGVFGFFSHPELTAESPQKASGNYGLMDQTAAPPLGARQRRAVRRRPGAGHHRRRVRGLVLGQRADGVAAREGAVRARHRRERRVLLDTSRRRRAPSRSAGAWRSPSASARRRSPSCARCRPPSCSRRRGGPACRASANVDGWFFPQVPAEIFAAGQQARVPLLAGWNSEEMNGRALLRGDPTPRRRAPSSPSSSGRARRVFAVVAEIDQRVVRNSEEGLVGRFTGGRVEGSRSTADSDGKGVTWRRGGQGAWRAQQRE